MQLKISALIYDKAIKTAFSANAGEENPDPEAVKEVQKAMVIFVKNIIQQAVERSIERDQALEKIYPEDILYIFKDDQKYLDPCAKSLLNYQYGQIFSKLLKNRGNPQMDYNDQDAFSSQSIERWQESEQ